MGGTHTTTREEALQLVQTTFLEFGDILENLNRTVMRHGVENMQPDAVQLAQQVLDYSTNCYDPNLYTNGYAKLSNDGVSELLELCRKLSRLYKLPVSSHIPDGSLAITFELIPWFITSMQQMALARLDDNVNELQQVRERLLSEATQYIEGDGSSLDAIIRANEDLDAIDYRIIENADRMVMLMGCADYEGHERVRQENKALVAQKQAITARTPLVGFIGHRGRRSINALTRDIQRACGKVASAQVKVRAKIVSGDFPVWQMTPVVMDVLSTPGLTPRDIQEITGWIERQQKWETIKDVLSFAIPVAAAITCFFVPGGASILLLAVRAGAQAVNAVVGIASGIEDFDEANTHRNMVYSQLIMPTENLVEGSVGEADMRYFLGFVSLIAGGIDALDAVQAARVVSRFKSLPLDIQKQMSRMGRQGVKLLENLSTNQLTAVSSMANAEAVFDASTRYLTQTGFDNLKKLPDYQITQALDYFPNDPMANMLWLDMPDITNPALTLTSEPAVIKRYTSLRGGVLNISTSSSITEMETALNKLFTATSEFGPEESISLIKAALKGDLGEPNLFIRVQTSNQWNTLANSSKGFAWVTDPVMLAGTRTPKAFQEAVGFTRSDIIGNLNKGGETYIDLIAINKSAVSKYVDRSIIDWSRLENDFEKAMSAMDALDPKTGMILEDFKDLQRTYPGLFFPNGTKVGINRTVLESNYMQYLKKAKPGEGGLEALGLPAEQTNNLKSFFNDMFTPKTGANNLFSSRGIVLDPEGGLSAREFAFNNTADKFKINDLNMRGDIQIRRFKLTLQPDDTYTFVHVAVPK